MKVADANLEESLFDQFGGHDKLVILVDTWMKSIAHDEVAKGYDSKYNEPVELELLKEKYLQYLKFLFGG